MEKFLSGAAFTMYFEHLRVPNEEHIVRDERTDTEFAIAKKKDEREKFEWKILREKEKSLKTDEMKANDNRFLACIHIHCSNVERESVEISEHQPINMASALIFSLGNWVCVCVCVRVVFGISIDYSLCTAKRLLSLRLQELFHSLLLFPQRYRRQTTHRTY